MNDAIAYSPTLAGIGVGQVIWWGIGLALTFAAAAFQRTNTKSNTQTPDLTAGTASTRGATIPLLVGRRLLDPVVCWVGNPEAEPQYSTVRSKGAKKKKVLQGYKYYEDAMHGLCVGPANAINVIRERGEVIYTGPISADTTPSGTSFTATDGSQFTVYWGEPDQPLALSLIPFLSVQSRFPGLCYIHWSRKLKGNSRQWPELKYDVTGLYCEGSALGTSNTIDPGSNAGANAAHVAWMLLTGERPYGQNLPITEVDKTSLEAWAASMATDAVPTHILFGEGTTAGSGLESLARDFGLMYPQIGARLAFKLLRKPDTMDILDLDSDRIRGNPRPRISHDDRQVTRRIYTFANIAHRFQRDAVEVASGGQAQRNYGYVDSEDRIDSVTDEDAANYVAGIRSTYENNITGEVDFVGLRDAENIHPGDVVDTPNTGRMRSMETTLELDSGVVELRCAPGLMTNLVTTPTVADTGGESATKAVAVDPRVIVVDAPDQNDGDPAIVVLRLREHEQVSGASVHVSADSGNYVEVFTDLPAVAGGDLDTGESIPTEPDAWAATTAYSLDDIVVPTDPRESLGLQMRCTTAGTSGGSEPTWTTTDGGTTNDGSAVWTAEDLETGPVFRAGSPDYNQIQDLTGDDTAWENEAQYALFSDGLLVSLQKVEAVSVMDRADSTAYSLNDERIPTGVSTGLVYVVTTAGTSAASEPDANDWRVEEGETVTDGTVTWTASYPRYTMTGIRWTGETRTVGNLTGDDGVYIAPADQFQVITDARIVAGASVDVKTQPNVNGTTISLASVTETSITPS